MAVITLKGERRTGLGKGGARKARAAGRIPGVVYGHHEAPVPMSISAREFELAMLQHKGGNAIVNLSLDPGEVTALIRDVQYDPVTHGILHLDFQHISLTEMVEVKVAVHVKGIAIGVKDGGGVLEQITREVEVRCLPTAIPAFLELDVSPLAIGQSLHVRDLGVEGVAVLTDADQTVVTVVAPTVQEDKPAGEIAPEAATEPEVVGAKGKKEEGEEEKDKDKEKKDKDKDKEKDKEKAKAKAKA
jgi:large subunit ribosomal protein L25